MNHDTTLASRLRSHVETLCSFDPPRCWGSPGLGECGTWVRETLAAAAGAAHAQEYEVTMGGEPELVSNVVARLGDGPKPLRVIGAHYDAVAGTPGADDNASAVAVLLELARLLAKAPRLDAPVELVAYTLEEPPTFATEQMGSAIHALRLRRAGTRVEGMISLEMVGYFDATTGSQDYPAAVRPFLPSAPATGTFYALTSKEYARRWLTTVDSGLRSRLKTPLLALAVPDVYGGIDLSDHVPYQELGIPAAMLGDTSRYRNPHYHEPTDLPDTLDYERMADLTTALAGWLSDDAA